MERTVDRGLGLVHAPQAMVEIGQDGFDIEGVAPVQQPGEIIQHALEALAVCAHVLGGRGIAVADGAVIGRDRNQPTL
jgi:hypothetical protein